jgi:glycosidase
MWMRFYDPASQMQLVTFLDNHDNPRFLSTSESNNNTNGWKWRWRFFTHRAAFPCLYYGTEQGFDGTTDPDDREDMFAGEFKDGPVGHGVQLSSPGVDNFNMTHPLFLWVAQLNNFRRLYPAHHARFIRQSMEQFRSGPGLFAYSGAEHAGSVCGFQHGQFQPNVARRTLTYPAGTVLVNLLNTNETYTLTSGSQTPGHHRARP